MTIRQRLYMTHWIMFIAPILMTIVILLSAAAGVFIFIRSGNHVYIESSDQFNHASEALYYGIFHGRKSQKELDNPANYDWLVQVLAPRQNYVILEKENRVIYSYGNEALWPLLDSVPPKERLHERRNSTKGTYSLLVNTKFCSVRKRTVDGAVYYLYYVSRAEEHGTDDFLEEISAGTGWFMIITLFAFILFTSWFLVDLIIRRLLPPLDALRKGAEKIQQGDLDIHLKHKEKDEFTPVFSAFNMMAQELSTSLKARAEEEESRKELIASMSHDIRTPLTAIKAYVEGLADGVANTEEKRQRYFAVIQKKTTELDSMVEQLFLLSKMDVGNKAVPLERLDLSALLARVVEENRDDFLEKGLIMELDKEDHCFIEGNAMLLKRIFLNLWVNSVKYKVEEAGHSRMKLTCRRGRVELSVSDDGPGVPEAALPHLFEAFYRTDKARSRTGNGSGLGLAIVARAMKIMGGTVRAENAAPHGLSIVMTWPLAERKQDETDSDHRR